MLSAFTFNNYFYNNLALFAIYFIVAFFLACALIVLPALISFKVFSVEKVSAYECGFEPFPELGNRHVDVHFVVVALLFLLFDFELLLLLPFVLSCESAFFFIGVKPVLNLFLFLLIVTLAFVYEWISGALTWPISVIPRV